MTQPVRSASSTFPAELSSLYPMLSWVRNQVEEESFNDAEMRRIEIALEEALVNIIHYAYQGKVGVIEITYNYYPHEHIEIVIKDYGMPFNPLESGKKIDRNAPLEERKVGGLGISFIRELMDKMEYIRDGEANILTLKKHCQS